MGKQQKLFTRPELTMVKGLLMMVKGELCRCLLASPACPPSARSFSAPTAHRLPTSCRRRSRQHGSAPPRSTAQRRTRTPSTTSKRTEPGAGSLCTEFTDRLVEVHPFDQGALSQRHARKAAV